ncbi:MAG TPA: hypothetical protein VFS39_05245, partial [Nitrospira sp.]|nr:hypothetical protein [Nitrospira sp.]
GRYAALAALAVVLLQDVFWVSTKIEVYALHLLLVLAAYWIMYDDTLDVGPSARVLLLGIFTGLGAATHQITFIVLFPLYLLMLRELGWTILLAVPGFGLGIFSCYPAIVNTIASGDDVFRLLRVFLTGSDGMSASGWEGSLFRFDRMARDKNSVILVLVSLVGIGLLGLLGRPRGTKVRVLWWAATLDLLFSVSFGINDRFTFFLPGAAFYAILGLTVVHRRYAEAAIARYAMLGLILAHPLLMVGAYELADAGVIKMPKHRAALPYRDDIKYYLSPYLPDKSAERFVMEYERYVPEGSVVLSDFTPWAALRAAQVTGRFGSRVLQQCDQTDEAWPRTMYLVRREYCEQYLAGYSIEAAPLGWVASKDG